MKIAYVTDTIFPTETANGIQSVRMCEAFSNLGHDVTFYCCGIKKTFSYDHFLSSYGITNPFTVTLVNPIKGRFRSYRFVAKVWLLIKKKQPDIIFTRHLLTAFVTAILGKKVFYEIHKSPAIDGVLSRIIFRLLLGSKNLQRLIVISQALKKEVETNLKVTSDKIFIAHDGAKITEVTNVLLQSDNQKINIGYLGSPFVGKGSKMTALLAQRHPECTFHIVGSCLEEVQKQLSFPLSSNIFCYGRVPPGDTYSYLTKMDILIAPFEDQVFDISGREISCWMSPLKIFEYMAANRPIIATNHKVLCEVLTDRENALLCEPENLEQWSKALNLLVEDSSLRQKLAEKAYQQYLDHYTWEVRAKQILL